MKRLPLSEANYAASIGLAMQAPGAEVKQLKTVTRRVIRGLELHDWGDGPQQCECTEPRAPMRHWVYRGWTSPTDTFPPPLLMGEGRPYSPGEIVALTLPHWRWNSACGVHIWDRVTQADRFWEAGCVCAIPSEHKLAPNIGYNRRPAMFMPVWAALHFATIVSCEPQVLGDVTDQEAILEGCYTDGDYWYAPDAPEIACLSPIEAYGGEWLALNAARGYPWRDEQPVWRIQYRVKEAGDAEARG